MAYSSYRVRNLINDRGNAASNQFVITTPKGRYFQSYDTVVAKIDGKGNLVVSESWDYSNTTRKHLYIFMRDNGFGCYAKADDMRRAIKDGNVILKRTDSLAIE